MSPAQQRLDAAVSVINLFERPSTDCRQTAGKVYCIQPQKILLPLELTGLLVEKGQFNSRR